MANPYLPSEQAVAQSSPEALGIERQRKLADLLTAQATQQPQGQMISGHYVAPSWTQQLNPMANILAGNAISERADKQQTELAAALRGKKADAYSKFQTLMSNPETRGEAMQFASKNEFLQPMYQEFMKPREVAEGGKVVLPGINGNQINLAEGNPKYHPIQTIDLGTKGVMIIDSNTGTRTMMEKGKEAHAGQVVETANGPMLIDTRTGSAKPIMVNGEQLPPKLSSEQSKDIISINQQLKTIDGAIDAIKKNPSVFSYTRGLTGDLPKGETVAARYQKPEETAARSYVFNNVSAVIKERAGTAQSSGEAKRLNSFLPDTYDDAQTTINKFDGFKTYLKDLEAGTRQNPNVPNVPKTPQAPSAPKTPTVDPALLQYMTPEQKALFGIK